MWIKNLELMWITIKLVFSGSFVGLILAFFSAYFTALNLWKHNWWTWILRVIILVLRSLPIILIITIFKATYRGEMIAFMIFWYSTWLWLQRYFCDIFESSDTNKFYRDINNGMFHFKSFYINIFLNHKNKFLMNSLLAIESNIRWNSILGSVGVFGIGFLFNLYKNQFQYLGISVLYIVFFVFIFELILVFYNKYLFIAPKIKHSNKNTPKSWKYNYKKIINWVIFSIYFSIVIISFLELSQIKTDFYSFISHLKVLFYFDFSEIIAKPDIYLIYWEIFKQTYIAIYLGFVFAFWFAILMSEKLIQSQISIIFKSFIILLKSIPVIVFYVLFNSFLNPATSLVLSVIILTFRSMSKQFSETINKIDQSKIDYWKSLGYTKFFIYKNFLFPMYRKAILSLVLFESEGTYRNFITYGIFSSYSLYTFVDRYSNRDNSEEKILPLFVPAFIFYFLLELIFLIYKTQIWQKIYLKIIKFKS
ncbi:ABC transporter permease family protein [Mycoplasmopsis mustelae]|uniref:ABC transporter permease n=1 Tax=Mycoplasmopsis mustelae TaxID=171289 RepID=UPI001065854E|nr:ABC transporter permease [Mycoplasmopsis mustelae]